MPLRGLIHRKTNQPANRQRFLTPPLDFLLNKIFYFTYLYFFSLYIINFTFSFFVYNCLLFCLLNFFFLVFIPFLISAKMQRVYSEQFSLLNYFRSSVDAIIKLRFLSVSVCLCLSLSHTHFLSISLSQSIFLSFSFSLCLSVSLSLSEPLKHKHAGAHRRTHIQTKKYLHSVGKYM